MVAHLAHNQEVTWFESRLRHQAVQSSMECSPSCQDGDHGFESRNGRQVRLDYVGSSPTRTTNFGHRTEVSECLTNQRVTRSA